MALFDKCFKILWNDPERTDDWFSGGAAEWSGWEKTEFSVCTPLYLLNIEL